MLREIQLRSGKHITLRIADLRAMLVFKLHQAVRDGLVRRDLDRKRVFPLSWLVWNDGTSWIKRAVFAQLFRLIQKGCDIFVETNKKQTIRLTHPCPLQLSTDCPETAVAYEAFGFILGLGLQRLSQPIDVCDKEGNLLCKVAPELEVSAGDNHAHQGMMGHNMAGEHTCVFGHHPKSQWLGVVTTLNGAKKTLRSFMKAWDDKQTQSFMNKIPHVLLHDPTTDLEDRAGLHAKFAEVLDVPLHERTGAVKNLWRLWTDTLSKRQQSEVEERFKSILNRQSGYKEYMDGGNWLEVLLNVEAILLPSIEHYRSEAGWMFHYLREMVLLVCVDSRGSLPKEQLTLAMHANAIGLWLVTKDLMERGRVDGTAETVLDENVTLYLHHFMADIPVLFMDDDFRNGSCQVFVLSPPLPSPLAIPRERVASC